MADTNNQAFTIFRGSDLNIVLSGPAADFITDPTTGTFQFSVAPQRGMTPVLTVTSPDITVTGTDPFVATIPLTRAQTSLLTLDEYDWDLWDTDADMEAPKAGGTLHVLTPVFPPVVPA